MKHIFKHSLTLLVFFWAESIFSQDINPFLSDENKFSIGFQLSGDFPVGGFTHADISFPCNSSVSTGSAFELSLGCKINPNFGITVLLSEGFFEFDPSSLGAFELINDNPGLYQSAAVLKNGQFISQSAMGGVFYDLPISKNGKILCKSHALIGIMGCSVPNIEVVGYHTPGVPDSKGNSIDTIDTWATPKVYGYSLSYRLGTGVYYSLNKSFDVFIAIDFQGSSLTYTDTPVTYNLTVNSSNSTTGTSTMLTNTTHLTEVNPTITYLAVSVGLGCEVKF
jgi:hypothetical protein